MDGQTTRYTCPTRNSRGRGNPEGRPSGRVSPLARALQNYVIPAEAGIQRGWANGDPTTNV